MKKKYGLFSNLVFSYKKLYKTSRKQIPFQIYEVIFSIITPTIAIFIPSIIVNALQNKITINNLIFLCLAIFIVYGTISSINSYIDKRNFWRYISYREFIDIEYHEKALTVKLSDWENELFKKDYYAAMHALNMNSRGVEDFHVRFPKFVSAVFGFILYCLIASQLSFWIVGLLILLTLFHYLFFNHCVKEENKINRDIISPIYKQWNYFRAIKCDTKSGKDIRMYNLTNWILSKHKKASQQLYEGNKKIQMNYFRYEFIGILIQFVRDLVCYGYLLIQLKNGLDPSLFVLYIGLIAGISNKIEEVADMAGHLVTDSMLIDDLRYILDYQSEEEKTGLMLPSTQSISIEFKNVSFSYPDTERLILDHVSFKIDAGEKVALVGINGAGKSTIVKLICGFYQPTEGTIFINDIPLDELNRSEYLKLCSCVFQTPLVLSTPICENIACTTQENIDFEKLEVAIKNAGLSDRISQLPDGYYSYINKDIDENGASFSGGEIQKLMLARALYRNSALYLLDEPTAALDALAENKVYSLYDETIKNVTSLFISHRLSSTKFCNKILVLDEGQIKEIGSHDELIATQGYYAKMFKIQSQYYEEGSDLNEIQTTLL